MLIEICPGTAEYFMYINTFSPYHNSLTQVGLIPVYIRKLRHKELRKLTKFLHLLDGSQISHKEQQEHLLSYWASLIAQLVKNLPAMQETPVQFLGQEDPLETAQATHSSILGLPLWLSWERIRLQCGRPGFNRWVGKIPWRRERLPTPVFWPGEFHGLYSPWGCQESDASFTFTLHFNPHLIDEDTEA